MNPWHKKENGQFDFKPAGSRIFESLFPTEQKHNYLTNISTEIYSNPNNEPLTGNLRNVSVRALPSAKGHARRIFPGLAKVYNKLPASHTKSAKSIQFGKTNSIVDEMTLSTSDKVLEADTKKAIIDLQNKFAANNSGMSGGYCWGTKDIFLMVDAGNDIDSDSFTSSTGSNFFGAALHEMGHSVYNDSKLVNNTVKQTSDALFLHNKQSNNFATLYASTNPLEYFAEGYSLYVHKPKYLRARDPGMFMLMQSKVFNGVTYTEPQTFSAQLTEPDQGGFYFFNPNHDAKGRFARASGSRSGPPPEELQLPARRRRSREESILNIKNLALLGIAGLGAYAGVTIAKNKKVKEDNSLIVDGEAAEIPKSVSPKETKVEIKEDKKDNKEEPKETPAPPKEESASPAVTTPKKKRRTAPSPPSTSPNPSAPNPPASEPNPAPTPPPTPTPPEDPPTPSPAPEEKPSNPVGDKPPVEKPPSGLSDKELKEIKLRERQHDNLSKIGNLYRRFIKDALDVESDHPTGIAAFVNKNTHYYINNESDAKLGPLTISWGHMILPKEQNYDIKPGSSVHIKVGDVIIDTIPYVDTLKAEEYPDGKVPDEVVDASIAYQKSAFHSIERALSRLKTLEEDPKVFAKKFLEEAQRFMDEKDSASADRQHSYMADRGAIDYSYLIDRFAPGIGDRAKEDTFLKLKQNHSSRYKYAAFLVNTMRLKNSLQKSSKIAEQKDMPVFVLAPYAGTQSSKNKVKIPALTSGDNGFTLYTVGFSVYRRDPKTGNSSPVKEFTPEILKEIQEQLSLVDTKETILAEINEIIDNFCDTSRFLLNDII